MKTRYSFVLLLYHPPATKADSFSPPVPGAVSIMDPRQLAQLRTPVQAMLYSPRKVRFLCLIAVDFVGLCQSRKHSVIRHTSSAEK